MPASFNDLWRASRPKWGYRLEAGHRRTSTTQSISWGFKSARNCSKDRVEWPIVWTTPGSWQSLAACDSILKLTADRQLKECYHSLMWHSISLTLFWFVYLGRLE